MTKKTNTVVFIGILIASFVLYLFTDFACTGSCYVMYEREYLDPLFFGLLGLVPATFVLLFFSEKIFISWVKYILWWFVLIVAWMVLSNGHENTFSPFANDIVLIWWSMTFLFIITLIYALVMNRKYTKESLK